MSQPSPSRPTTFPCSRAGLAAAAVGVEYQEYINSSAWKNRKKLFLLPGANQCERCGRWKSGRDIQVHHKHYRTLGREERDDVEILCCDCHPAADRERARRSKARAAADLEEARLDGWASKVYGDGWEYRLGREAAEAAFLDWLDGRDA